MILFSEDFAKYPGSIVDTRTTNMSFIRMSMILNKMCINNRFFFLALTQPELQGYDPHNLKDNSIELKQRIAYECKINPWYFIREVVRITEQGSGGSPYILNRSNLAQAWVFFNSIDGFQCMPRQIGKTIGTMVLTVWYLYIGAYNCNWGMFCKGLKLQSENVDRLKKIRDALPPWLVHQTLADTNNKEGVTFAELQNSLITFVAQSDKIAAGDQARGQSHAVQHWDEIVYYDNIDKSFPAASAAMSAAGEQALKAGLPSATIITSTAGDIDDPRGREAYRMVCKAIRFTEHFYDCKDREDLMSMIRLNSKNNMVYIEFNHKQLGKSDEWFEKNTANKDPKTVAKDYMNQWLHGSEGSIFPKDLLDQLQCSRKDPITVTYYESLAIRWYDNPKILTSDTLYKDRPYVMACDTSDNVGRDFTSFCMLDPYDMHTVATFKCNTTNLAFVARCILKFMKDFPRSIFIPERNKNGAMLLDFIFAETRRETFNPLQRIYNSYFQNYTQDTNVKNLDYGSGTVRKEFGFNTSKSATSREFLYGTVMMTALKLNVTRLYDNSLIDEICGLTMKNGRVDHSEQGHDDLFISYLLACYFILFGRNHQLYGIGPDEFMCNIEANGNEIEAEEKRQKKLAKARIVELRKLIDRDVNIIVKQAHQRELNKLMDIIGDEDIIDDTIKPLEQVDKGAITEAKRNRNYSVVDLYKAL